MICRADTVGVFQIESRAQMSMLPRLRPRTYYDLVIEVAIVRPGPIQGDMVHPYLRRRDKKEPITYPDATVETILGKTLGVPLFQEQAMQLAIHCAGFSADEADKLRRAVTGFRHVSSIQLFGEKIISGMLARGYPREFAEKCFEQIKGFSTYGFPESHAASFALLAYASAYLKCHYPAVFCCALLNSQPMGFYQPAQIVQDAQRHGVEVRPIDVHLSGWECSLEERTRSEEPRARSSEVGERSREAEGSRVGGSREERGLERHEEVGGGDEGAAVQSEIPNLKSQIEEAGSHPSPASPPPRPSAALGGEYSDSGLAVRLGMNQIRGMREDEARAIARAVAERGPFTFIERLWRASGVRAAAMKLLAGADAFGSMGLDRQSALWHAGRLRDEPLPLFDERDARAAERDHRVPLPELGGLRHVTQDYQAAGISLRGHPIAFVRDWLDGRRAIAAADLADERRHPQGRRVTVAGVCLVRQRPGTARNITFMTLEDETGTCNLVVFPEVFERCKAVAGGASAMMVRGRVERQGEVVHVRAERFWSLDDRLREMRDLSRNFR